VRPNIAVALRAVAVAAGMALVLAGCAYDYFNRHDRVAYSAGDAVKANLEMQTVNPSSASQYSVKGLGKNGVVVPREETPAEP
jgi:hypothetical protein